MAYDDEENKKCTAAFIEGSLERALPKKVKAKYEEAVFEAAIEGSGIKNICKCPKCDFTAMLPETERIFRCPNPGCFYKSCRECGEPPHLPLKCDEVEKESHASARKKIEEAMTEARVRVCPSDTCHKRFYKTEGCNKMTCACTTIICYVCRGMVEKQVGYKHFCQISNCNHKECGKCPLFTNSIEDDRQAMREAGIKALNSYEGRIASTGDQGVDIDRLLEANTGKADEMERAARIAQQYAAGGVGAMARAYNDPAVIARGHAVAPDQQLAVAAGVAQPAAAAVAPGVLGRMNNFGR